LHTVRRGFFRGFQLMQLNDMLAFAAALLGVVVALSAAFRERRSISKWCFVAGMTLLALESIFSGLAAHTTDQGSETIKYWQHWRLVAMAFLPGTWLMFSLSYARGNYREFLLRWRFMLVVVFILPIAIVWFFFRDLITIKLLSIQPDVWLFHLTTAGLVLYVIFLITAVLVLVNLERTFRASVGTIRWRIKFMILGMGVLFAVRVYTSSQALLWPRRGIDELLLMMDSAGLLLGCILVLRSLLRKQVDVAVYPPFAVLQNSLIVLLAGIYLLVVGVFAKFVEWLGGDASFPVKAFLILVVLVGLTVLGLSDRVRLHSRRFLSRYLQRPLYDYRTVWRSFTEAIASRVKQEELCEAAAKQVAEIFQALSVTIWLVDEKRENLNFAASTSLSPAAGRELAPQKEEARAIILTAQERAEPMDIELSREAWAVALRRCHPSQFRTGGSRVCVPMTAGRQLMGVMIAGDRVGGAFFSLQDFDLLKCVGDQVAAGLLNVNLSQKLLQAKELEAFQTMSAFFVHDLKNTASTLNLMLKNLPVHFDNPAFREDALRGVAKTCDHINHLISRLSLLRHDLQIRPAESDLNDIISRVLASWNGATGVTLVKNFRPCPKIFLDQEQILKVVTNLVLNATEAVASGGEIVVETGQNNGWAVLTVADNGCGMAPEFLRRALFRPFQTTKKNGFGIGMFQSKMIIEAHGGRIEVESELERGTTFRVLLPVQKQTK
jgi:putative PEP-CTERM system histidine kinase